MCACLRRLSVKVGLSWTLRLVLRRAVVSHSPFPKCHAAHTGRSTNTEEGAQRRRTHGTRKKVGEISMLHPRTEHNGAHHRQQRNPARSGGK